jgi:uncharacterized protein (TIGR02453 family)
MLTHVLEFLTALKENNHKEWFDENRNWYQQSKKEFELFVSLLISEMQKIDKEIGPLETKDCTFRIFRDVRFSPDKTPYKTHMGAYIAKGGRKSPLGGYYFHLEPGNSVLAGGIWAPAAPVLKALRSDIYGLIEEFTAIVEGKEFKKQFKELDTDMGVLRSAPKDFPKDFPQINYLKYKSYTVSKPVPDHLIADEKALLAECAEVFSTLMPLNAFFNRTIREMGND